MKNLLLLLLCSPFGIIFAQPALTGALNSPRPGDRIVKQQIVYLEPGASGNDAVWDFSRQEAVNADYELKYSRYGDTDTIVGTEQRTLHYYKLSGDSLLLHGYENPTNLINYHNPEVLLIFPLAYGDSFTGYASSAGLYDNFSRLYVHGKSTVSVDACGTLILPEGDTLRDVLRVYTHRRSIACPVKADKDTLSEVLPADSIEYRIATDSVRWESETWRWYAGGYRYPVVESIRTSNYLHNQPVQVASTSFYYPPQEQYYDLASDPLNQQLRDRKQESEDDKSDQSSHKGNTEDILRYNYYVDTGNTLYLSYDLREQGEVWIALYDLQGRQLSSLRKETLAAGGYREQLSLTNLPGNEYLLQIICNDKMNGVKIVKH